MEENATSFQIGVSIISLTNLPSFPKKEKVVEAKKTTQSKKKEKEKEEEKVKSEISIVYPSFKIQLFHPRNNLINESITYNDTKDLQENHLILNYNHVYTQTRTMSFLDSLSSESLSIAIVIVDEGKEEKKKKDKDKNTPNVTILGQSDISLQSLLFSNTIISGVYEITPSPYFLQLFEDKIISTSPLSSPLSLKVEIEPLTLLSEEEYKFSRLLTFNHIQISNFTSNMIEKEKETKEKEKEKESKKIKKEKKDKEEKNDIFLHFSLPISGDKFNNDLKYRIITLPFPLSAQTENKEKDDTNLSVPLSFPILSLFFLPNNMESFIQLCRLSIPLDCWIDNNYSPTSSPLTTPSPHFIGFQLPLSSFLLPGSTQISFSQLPSSSHQSLPVTVSLEIEVSKPIILKPLLPSIDLKDLIQQRSFATESQFSIDTRQVVENEIQSILGSIYQYYHQYQNSGSTLPVSFLQYMKDHHYFEIFQEKLRLPLQNWMGDLQNQNVTEPRYIPSILLLELNKLAHQLIYKQKKEHLHPQPQLNFIIKDNDTEELKSKSRGPDEEIQKEKEKMNDYHRYHQNSVVYEIYGEKSKSIEYAQRSLFSAEDQNSKCIAYLELALLFSRYHDYNIDLPEEQTPLSLSPSVHYCYQSLRLCPNHPQSLLLLIILLLEQRDVEDVLKLITNLDESPLQNLLLGLYYDINEEKKESQIYYHNFFHSSTDSSSVSNKLEILQMIIELSLSANLVKVTDNFFNIYSSYPKYNAEKDKIYLANKARYEYLLQHYEQCLSLCQQYLQIDSLNQDIYGIMGRCYQQQDLNDKSIEYYQKSFDLGPDTMPLEYLIHFTILSHQQGSFSQATDLYLLLSRRSPSFYSWLGCGICFLRLEKYTESEKCFAEANIYDTQSNTVWAYLTILHLKTNSIEEAKSCLSQCYLLHLDNSQLWSEIALAFQQHTNNHPENIDDEIKLCQDCLEMALKYDKDNPQYHLLLAQLLENFNPELSRSFYQNVISICENQKNVNQKPNDPNNEEMINLVKSRLEAKQ